MTKNVVISLLIGLTLPVMSTAADQPGMAQFTAAKSEVASFAASLGAYSACYELVKDIKNEKYVSDEAATLKTLFQNTKSPEKLKIEFLEKLESKGYSFDQMYMLDEILEKRAAEIKRSITAQFYQPNPDDIIVVCSQARSMR